MQQKILVTGATGFIGNYVVKELLQKGYKVIATSSSYEKARFAEWFNEVTYIPFNFKDFDGEINYFIFFQQPDKVIHLAWEGLPNYKDAIHITKNLPLQKAFLKNLLQNGLRDLTVTGTCLEYGMIEGCLSETMMCLPSNNYAIAKDLLRKEIMNLEANYQFNFKWIRLFYMYGKGQSPNSLISQLEMAIDRGKKIFDMSGGEQMRDFLPIAIVAKNIIAISMQTKMIGIINNCSGYPIKVKDFVRKYIKERNVEISLNLGYFPYQDYEPMEFWGDNKKLKTIVENE